MIMNCIKKLVYASLLLLPMSAPAQTTTYTPSKEQLEARKRFENARLGTGVFIALLHKANGICKMLALTDKSMLKRLMLFIHTTLMQIDGLKL